MRGVLCTIPCGVVECQRLDGRVELPSDISGVVYVNRANWELDVAREMEGAGYEVDFSKIVGL